MAKYLTPSIFRTLCASLVIVSSMAQAQVSVAFDPVDAYGLRKTVFGPFVALGKVPVSENSLLRNATHLPKNIPAYWQVVSVGKDLLLNECTEQGRLTPLDLNNIPHKELLIPSAIERCGIGYAVTGTVLAYSVMHKYGTPPNSWSDLFDFNRYPGKRAFPKQARHLMEVALLADGIPKDKLYQRLATEQGQKQALDKLTTIYDEIIWWEDIGALQSWLTDGLIALAIAPDGAILQQEGFDNIGVSRNNVIYAMRYYAIQKAASNINLAYAFLSFATQPSQQQNYAATTLYGTTLKQGWTLITPEKQTYLTNYPQNLQSGILEDYTFYAQHGEQLENTFTAWFNSKKTDITRVVISIKEEAPNPLDPKVFVGPMPPVKDTFVGPMPPEPAKLKKAQKPPVLKKENNKTKK